MSEPEKLEGKSRKNSVIPFIPASESLPEITLKAVILGFSLSALLAGANAYLGLKVGMTVSASIPAAVISMALLRLFRQHNILENNIVQTAASAGEALSAGVIFTLPALIMLQYWTKFEFLPTLAISAAGGILGVLFTIPLRRALIVEAKLQFPEGVATAEVLKAGERGGEGARLIGMAGLAGAFLKLCQTGFKLVAGSAGGSVTVGGALFGIGSDLGVALLGVGFIVGLNIAVLVFAGGAISWFIGIPLFTVFADPAQIAAITNGAQGYAAAEEIWSAQIRYMGVGAMAAGGLYALISLWGPVRDGLRSSRDALAQMKMGGSDSIPRTERDTPIHFVIIGTLAMAVPILIVFMSVIDQDALMISDGRFAAMLAFSVVFALVAGFIFSAVAGYMAGLVGSSNNPISGVTIATILTISLILLAFLGSQTDFVVDTTKATAAAATAIMVGAVVACAAALAGDNLQDLKAGQLLGATPVKQQIMQMVGVVAAAIVIAPVLQLLFTAYGMGDVFPRAGMDASEALKAPQATLMSSVAKGVFTRNLPWGMIWTGVAIAIGIILLDKNLEARKSTFRAPVLAVAVGIYLPLELSVPIFAGGMIAFAVSRTVKARWSDGEKRKTEQNNATTRGLLFASGLITGEALVGILLAIPFAASQSTDVLALAPQGFETIADILGIIGFSLFCVWLYKVAKGKQTL
ncbi:MAG: oligopeptide transporter, OPT family, partial [Bacteroidetes bacterium]